MLKIVTDNKLLFIAIHMAIGILATFSFFPKLYGAGILAIGFLVVLTSSNHREEALMISSYVVGVEVFLRMIKGAISYETGKYGILLFLLMGMLVGPTKQKSNIGFLVYIFLLLVGIAFTQVPDGESLRKAIAFNLSGPVVLGICAMYFYKRPISFSQLMDTLFFMTLPIFSMVVYIYYRTPNLEEMVFGTGSNYTTSGNFGPNQVATILGAGIFVLAAFIFLKVKLSGFLIIDAIFLAYFTFRGLLTFSRGGIFTAGVAFIIFAIFILIYRKGSIQTILKYLAVTSFFILGVWLYTSDITGGMIDNRYASKDRTGKEKEITTGRLDVFTNQLESFKEAPLFGIGVGVGKFKREQEGELVATSHNEVSRLIEEHGLIGVVILILLFAIPIAHFRRSNSFQKAFIVSFFLFWFLTINHSAMRVAFPSFIYGLCLIRITDDGS